MSPIVISSINTANLPVKYSLLSNYAQRYLKSQVKSISFALNHFFSENNLKLISENEQKIKDIGIKQIGGNIEEGIIISGDKCDYHVFVSGDNTLGFDILKSDSNQAYQHFCLNDKSDEYTHAGNFTNSNTEDTISETLDLVDTKLHEAKRICLSGKMPQLFIPRPETSKKIEELNNTVRRVPKNAAIEDFGYIGTKEKELAKTIIEKFQTIHKLYKKIPDGHSRTRVRSYYKNYVPLGTTNKLGFKNIGPSGEDINLFYTTHKKTSYLALEITDASENKLQFVISQNKGTVQRNLPYRFSISGSTENRIHSIPDYYTQKEIDNLNIDSYLNCLNNELEQFTEHTKNWLNKQEETKSIRSNTDIATLEQYKELLKDISSNFEEYRTKMRKYLRKSHKRKQFKAENNISAQLASTAVKFEKITPEEYDLRLSYPKVHDKTATQLLVMSGDEIKKSFYIYDNKLLRFNIKDLNDKFQNCCYNLYYYDNKYLRESDFEKYFSLIRDKLHDLNQKLDTIREKQLENRKRYNIKSPNGKLDYV